MIFNDLARIWKISQFLHVEFLNLIMKKIFPVLILVLFFGCSKEKNHTYGFYYWKTRLSLKESEKAVLEQSTLANLYVRFFDVDKVGGKFQPVSVISKSENFRSLKNIVPVIFITNRTFLYIKASEIDFLAKSIHQLIEKKTKELSLKDASEIQIDCDWTAGTKNDYFNFLKKLKVLSHKAITSTLRLHQVKDKITMGIPPVSKVYLMCYSTSSPLENSDKNSILDIQILKNYLSDVQNYSIKKIDVALPIYSWGIITNHFGKHKLINALSEKDLNHKDLEKISENEAVVKKDGFFFGYYLNKGFRIKVEQIPEQTLNEAVNFLGRKIPKFNIIYYQLDERFIRNRNLNR